MSSLQLSIIIPTRDRPHLLPIAVRSALAQTIDNFEVIVVDDASKDPVELPEDARLRVIHLPSSRGGAGARNVGTIASQGRWITYLDDDDRLLPHMAAVSLAALEKTTLPPPVAVISGIEVVNPQGERILTRLPPPLRQRGAHFSLEEIEPGKSYNTKQTLVVERETILSIGGWDETFKSRVHSEIFFRLNLACSIMGLSEITYQLYSHDGARVSRNPVLRQESFKRLIEKHQDIFQAHPQAFARFLYRHALMSHGAGDRQAAFVHLGQAMSLAPLRTFSLMASSLKAKFSRSYPDEI